MALKQFYGQRFEVKKAFRRGLDNGDKLQLILEAPYTRKMGVEVAKIDGLTVDITMVENPDPPQLPDQAGGQPDEEKEEEKG